MDDSCAVCAGPLEWVAYGACLHKEVCSTCVTRLRFICNDRRCCICKTESDVVYVTRAMGDYTMLIKDFSADLPSSELRIEGRLESSQYWYHEDTQAIIDDSDHYKTIKAMCNLFCSECDKSAEKSSNDEFLSIEQLKGHLFHKHGLFMCHHCLEGRKVFIGEQRLYTRTELDAHSETGDNENGFKGHPMCEFCGTRFYGDNELYTHMNTKHEKCHLCRDPGVEHRHFRNYDAMETHFRVAHFLCEDDSCLEKKFVVFQTLAEFKRHCDKEHHGSIRPSRIPRWDPIGDGKVIIRDPLPQISAVESSTSRQTNQPNDSSSSICLKDACDFPSLPIPIVNLGRTDTKASSSSIGLEDSSSFPSLPSGSSSSQSTPTHDSHHNALLPKTAPMASLFRRPNNNGRVKMLFKASTSHSEFPSLVGNGSAFPPISKVCQSRASTSKQTSKPLEDVQCANRVLEENIRAALEFDEDKYKLFRDMSRQYSEGLVDTELYLDVVSQFGLLHLVLDLARLCPNAQKQRELINANNAIVRSTQQVNVRVKKSHKGKGKSIKRTKS